MTLDGISGTGQVTVRGGLLTAAGLALGVAVTNGLARFAYALILPAMRSDLGWNYTEAGWNNTANAIGYLAGAAIAFRAVRRVSPRRLFAANLWVTAAALTLTGLTADFILSAVLRFVAGAAGAVAFVAGSVLAANIFARDAARSATAIAVYFAGGGTAILLSGLTMPWLFAYAGDASWPYAWIGMGVVSVAMTLVAIGAARGVREHEIRAGDHGWIKRPFMPLLLAYGIFGVGYIAYMTFIIAWLREHGARAGEVALFWAVLGLATILAPPVWRRALAEWPGGRPLAAVLVAMAVGGALPLWQTTPAIMLVSAVMFGGSFFAAPTAIAVFSRKALPPSQWGEAIAGFTTLFALCQCFGPVLTGALSDAAGNLFAGLGFSAAILVVGAVIALRQNDLKVRPELTGVRTENLIP